MPFKLQKTYVDKNFENFLEDFQGENLSNDTLFTYFTLGCLFEELDPYNLDDTIITDGGEDKQIDVVYINEEKNEINILQVKNTSSGGFSSNIITQIKNGLSWFFEDTKEVLKIENTKLKNKIIEARDSDLTWDRNMKINVYFCDLSDSDSLSKEAENEADKLCKEYKEVFSGFNFYFIGVKEYYNLIKKDEEFSIDDHLNYLSSSSKIEYDIDSKTRGLVVTVNTKEIASLVEDYGDKLFDKNIRYSFGLNNVNKKIYDTATGENSKFFWYFNNGITIVCDSFENINNPDYKSIFLKNIQLVNGCQTSTTLYNAYKEGYLKDSYVLLKIFSSSEEGFINTITEATNSQTSINSRDLAANEELQKFIEDNLKQEGYYYERKRNQYKGQRINKSNKINNEKLGQTVMSIMIRKPSKARSKKTSIFSNEYYYKVFNRHINELLFCYLIFSYVEDKRNNISLDDSIESQIKLYGSFHISTILGNLLLNKRSKKEDYISYLKNQISNIKENDYYLDDIYNESVEKLIEIVNEDYEEIYSFTNFFKKTTTEDKINQKLQ